MSNFLKLYHKTSELWACVNHLQLCYCPLPKQQLQQIKIFTFSLDQVAVPEFLAGAMENWGLVIYRETNLMYDPMESSSYYKQRVPAVIAHEMVHQVNKI